MLLQEQKLICVANTGPLISAFQCGRVDLLELYFSTIHVPSSCWAEYEKHGIADGIQQLAEEGLVVVHVLTEAELEIVRKIAEAIASSPMSRDPSPRGHIPDAEAIVLMQKEGLEASVLLVDELAARAIAQQRGLPIIGFIGVLIAACQHGMMSPESVRDYLKECQRQGTYYSDRIIETVYRGLIGGV